MKDIRLLLLLTLFILSCSDAYEQNYPDFKSFKEANLRNKSWFPKIIDTTAYDLKSISYLDKLADFGAFKYSNTKHYDTVFEDSKNSIKFSEFMTSVNKHGEKIPNWYLDIKKVDISNFETIKIDRFYITRNKEKRQIYFVLTN